MKTYLGTGKHYFRIGKSLIMIDFDKFNGEYTPTAEIFARAIENSELFRTGVITIK